SGQGLLFTDEAVVYSPGQFVSNITAAMDPAIDASETLGFLMEAMTWVTVVLQTGWLEKFPRLKAAVLESNASWLPLILSPAAAQAPRQPRRDLQPAVLHRVRVRRTHGVSHVGPVPGRGHLVVGLSAPRRRGCLGGARAHGQARRPARRPAQAHGRQRPPPL